MGKTIGIVLSNKVNSLSQYFARWSLADSSSILIISFTKPNSEEMTIALSTADTV